MVSTTLILNSGVYLLFGFPFGIKMPPSLDFLLVYFYYTTLSNKRGAFQLHFGGFVILNRAGLLQKKADSYDETLYFHDIF